MQARNLIQFPNKLKDLEDEAQTALDESIKALSEFVSILETIQDSDLWTKDYPSWPAYLLKRWGLKSSTLRGYRATVRTGDMIMSIVADVTPSKQEADKVKRALAAITSDTRLKASTYALAYETTGKIAPSKGELEAAYEAVYSVQVKNIVTVDGVDYDMGKIAETHIAREIITEDKARQSLYIEASQGVESKRLEINQNQAITALFTALGMEVPQGHGFVLYWKQARD